MRLLEQDVVTFVLIPEIDTVIDNPNYICTPFCQDEMAVILPVSHPLAGKDAVDPEDLTKFPFLISQVQSATRTFLLKKLGSHGISVPEPVNMYNTEAIKQGILNGMGISVLSKKTCSYELRNGFLKALPLSGIELTRTLYAVHKKKYALPADALLFIEEALQTE